MNISHCKDFDVKVEGDVISNSGDQYKTYNYGDYNTTNNGCYRESRTRDSEYYDSEQEYERPGARRRKKTQYDRSRGHPYANMNRREYRAQHRRNRLDSNTPGPPRIQNRPANRDTRGGREQRQPDSTRAYSDVPSSRIPPARAAGGAAAHRAASTILFAGPDSTM
ncbi:hypothetical protein WG66_010542 [Moniliophthora roreri]|uniref:Uncharacterized protein n=1 Tax=Moniliophthora roreri TaxID=221103 RepID=A0A0W0F4D9_MONRR|nr:hypothetical protein WG66_010542 [Moniliophthora roreri]